MGINDKLAALDKEIAVEREQRKQHDRALEQVAVAMTTVMQLQQDQSKILSEQSVIVGKQGVHIGLLIKIVYGAIIVTAGGVGYALLDLVIKGGVHR